MHFYGLSLQEIFGGPRWIVNPETGQGRWIYPCGLTVYQLTTLVTGLAQILRLSPWVKKEHRPKFLKVYKEELTMEELEKLLKQFGLRVPRLD